MTAVEGATVRVAGATTDLGRAITRRLEQRGAQVLTDAGGPTPDVLVLVADEPAAARRRAHQMGPALAAHGRGQLVVVGPETRPLADALRRELAGTGVVVSAILPGPGPSTGVGRWPDVGQTAVAAVASLHLAARATVRAIETGRAEFRLPAPTVRPRSVADDMPADLIARLLRRRGEEVAA
ncbi:MAG TPA: hypothetical protein VF228_22495 [Iamia sp.]